MSADGQDRDGVPMNKDGFKTSRARYEFNIDRLAKKYSKQEGQSDVEIDLRTFDMIGTDKDVKTEFKRLTEMGEKFSFATLSSPVVNAAELESAELAAKCRARNDIFKATQQAALGLPAPPVRLQITGGAGVATSSPITRSRSKAMIEGEPSTSALVRGGKGGDGTPMRPVEGRSTGARKTGGGGVAMVATGMRPVVESSGVQSREGRGRGGMMIEEDGPTASGIVARTQTVLDTMMASPTALPKRQRGTALNMTEEEDDYDGASGYGGGRGRDTQQKTPPNAVAIEEPVSSRTRTRTRLSLCASTPLAAIAAPSTLRAIAAPPTTNATAKKTQGRRLTMPTVKSPAQKEEKGGTKKEGGRKSAQGKGKKEEEQEKKEERKRSADETPNGVPKKQARVVQPKAVPPTAVVGGKKDEKDVEDGMNAMMDQSAVIMKKEETEVKVPVDGTDSSVQVVGQVYRDANTGRELVVEPESKDKKRDRIDSWLEDSFNRTMSDYGSQDDSAGPSSSSASAAFGDFERDRDVESFEKNLRRISSNAKSRNSNMKMGMVYQSGQQRRASASQGPIPPKNN